MAERITYEQINEITFQWAEKFGYSPRTRRLLISLLELIAHDIDIRSELFIEDYEAVIFSEVFLNRLHYFQRRDRRLRISEFGGSPSLALFHIAQDRKAINEILRETLPEQNRARLVILDKD